MNKFIGRKSELEQLQSLNRLGRVSLVVIKGRRRIGKSRLIREFSTGKRFLSFTGIAPMDRVTAQDQRDVFASQLAQALGMPPFTFSDWSDAFNHVSHHATDEPTIILFDEISWMGDKDPTFIPKLKAWWDLALQNYPQTILILCGSISMWIEENIIQSTAFFGRITLQIDLEQLTIPECADFLHARGFKSSLYDIFKILSVTGGIPWYLEQILPQYTADENIRRLCFEKNGILTLDFDRIFHDLFNGKGSMYKKIVHLLAQGMKDLSQIRQALEYPASGSLSSLMQALIVAGFVTQHYSWSFKTEKLGKQSLYRLSDNYLRFYVKYIEPNLAKIKSGSYQDFSLQNLSGWDSVMGLHVENLLLNNRTLLLKSLGIAPSDIVADNPFIQRPTTRQKGCQIDYLVQTHTKNLFVCEFKFKRRELGVEVVESVQEKIARFSTPRGFGVVPVLFHISGVTDAVHEKRYFYRIIDIADFVEL